MSSELWRIIHTLWKTSHDHSTLTDTHVETDLERSIGTSQATFSQGCWMCFALPNPQCCKSFAVVLLCDWLRRMKELCHRNDQRRTMEQTEGVTKQDTTFNQLLTNRKTNKFKVKVHPKRQFCQHLLTLMSTCFIFNFSMVFCELGMWRCTMTDLMFMTPNDSGSRV